MKSALLNPRPGTIVYYLGDFGAKDYKPKRQLVQITKASFMVDGRISNWFSWTPVNKDGTLGKEVSGYGNFERIPNKDQKWLSYCPFG